MKKSLLIALCLLSFGFLQAQIVILEGESNLINGDSSNASEELDLGWDVVCNEAVATDIKCVATVLEMTSGANYQYCWGNACSPWVATNNALQEIVTMSPQESNSSFHIRYRHYGNAGQSVVRLCWMDVNNTTNSFCYDLTFCVDVVGDCVVSVDEVPASAALHSISPNPANDLTLINFELSARPNNASLVIYTMLGEKVQVLPVNQRSGQLRVVTKDLVNGIYFCSLMVDGKKYETKRLVVHH